VDPRHKDLKNLLNSKSHRNNSNNKGRHRKEHSSPALRDSNNNKEVLINKGRRNSDDLQILQNQMILKRINILSEKGLHLQPLRF
jgi:hypothetical protein